MDDGVVFVADIHIWGEKQKSILLAYIIYFDLFK